MPKTVHSIYTDRNTPGGYHVVADMSVPETHHAQSHDMSSMAASATLHCLTGCAIGEIVGLVLSTALGWSNALGTVVAIALAFLFGYALSATPLLRAGIPARQALSLVLAADTVSIATMELVDNLVMWLVPGAMNARLIDVLFWTSMAASLVVAYVAAYPVNKYLLRQGKGHAITHHASGAAMNNKPLAYAITAFLLGGAVASLGTLL
jgi:hypothetical protein